MPKLLRLICLLLAAVSLTNCTLAEETAQSAPALRSYDKNEGYTYLTIGTFPQTAEGERQPILWRVLSVEEETQRALILSEYVLSARPLHGDPQEYANKPTNKSKPGLDGDYTQTDMAQYLNGKFTANFSSEEAAQIVPDEEWGMFFLLSADDLKNADYGFTSNESRKAWATEYAKANGVYVYGSSQGAHSPYWARTQSISNIQGARCTKFDGQLGYISVSTDNEGMRPACWLDLNAVVIQSGSGTMEDPYVLNVGTREAETAVAEENTSAADAQGGLVMNWEPAPGDKTITLTFTGDITLGGEDSVQAEEDTSFTALYEKNGPEYFLANFADFFAEDDLTIVNLEGILSDSEDLKSYQEGKIGSYFFRGSTEFVKVLTSASVEVASLANNHTRDYGDPGLRDTIQTLEAAGVEWVGTYDSNRSEYEKFLFYEKDGVTICLMSLCWDRYRVGDPEGSGAYLASEIQRIKESGEADAVICIFHGGQEYGRHRTRPQQVFTTMAMKAGADLVICHHAHVVMGMDVINNRSVLYSLGNFCFGGNKNAYQESAGLVQDAAPALVVRVVLTFAEDGTYKGQQLTLYPVQTTSVDRNGANVQINDYQPKFITGELGAHVLHLMQIDMNYDLKSTVNQILKDIVIAKEEELAAMESSEGMSSLTLPYLPAETAE